MNLNMTVAQAKKFFFDSKVVVDAVDEATRRNMQADANLIKVIAQRSMRKARRKKAGELTPQEKQRYELRVRLWEQGGKQGPKPQRPFLASKPGEPPKTRVGLVRKFLYAIFDPSTRSAVVGPARLAGKSSGQPVPAVLEYGGKSKAGSKTTQVKPRPFMAPAYATAQPSFAEQWRDSVKKG